MSDYLVDTCILLCLNELHFEGVSIKKNEKGLETTQFFNPFLLLERGKNEIRSL